jgi:hypothetical protein
MGVRDTIARALMGIRAYHGSPHDFNAFDLSKIGTGEGAQAYGHGLYFAGAEDVAKQYRDALKFRGVDWDNPEIIAKHWTDVFGGDRTKAMQHLEGAANAQKDRYASQVFNPGPLQKAINFLETDKPFTMDLPKGHMYEVNINADPAQMLDWDKALQAQTAPVKSALTGALDERYGKGFTSDYIGRGADYRDIHQNFDDLDPARLSAMLNERGIPGIKYLDEGSRTLAARANNPRNANWMADDAAWKASTPTSNYVVFDPSIIDIRRKYGIAGAAAAPAVGAAMGSTYDQNQYEAPP